MSDASFCYWSVATGRHGQMMTTCIASARRAGVREPFHVWTDTPVAGAECHPAGQFSLDDYWFKFDFLQRMRELPFEYFVFLDADSLFVRNPGDIVAQTRGAPVHVALECDCTRLGNHRAEWWNCPLPEYVRLMHECGVRSRSVFNTNAGFWIVHRAAVPTVIQLASEFREHALKAGYRFTEEAPLAYVGHMLMGNPYAHVVEHNPDVWASDWTGVFATALPDGSPWLFTDYLDGHQVELNPAIVHCMRSKSALFAAASPMRKPWSI